VDIYGIIIVYISTLHRRRGSSMKRECDDCGGDGERTCLSCNGRDYHIESPDKDED